MGKKYTPEERAEVLKLAGEIGNRQAADRLGVNIDTLYTWVSKSRQHQKDVTAMLNEKGPEGLIIENTRLKRELHESQDEVEMLQEALSFFVKRQKK
jgi:transposase